MPMVLFLMMYNNQQGRSFDYEAAFHWFCCCCQLLYRTDVRFEHVNLFFVHWRMVLYLNYMIVMYLSWMKGDVQHAESVTHRDSDRCEHVKSILSWE